MTVARSERLSTEKIIGECCKMEITPKDSVNIEAYVNQVQDKDKVDAASEQPEQ